jgi:hypothetical protein
MKNRDRIMAILDEIEDLSSDIGTEYIVNALRERVEWAYGHAEDCDLYGVLTIVGHYNWLGGLYKGLKRGLVQKSELPDVLDKIEDKIRDAEFLLERDLVEMLKTKCGCRSI